MFKALAILLVFLGTITLIFEITGSGKMKIFSIVGLSAFIIILLKYLFHKSKVGTQNQTMNKDIPDE